MSQRIQGVVFEPIGQMKPDAIKNAVKVVEQLAKAYCTGRDSATYASNVREESRDELIAALGAMRVRRFEAGSYRVLRTRDLSRTLNLEKVRRLLGDKASRLGLCYDITPRYSINVMAHRTEDLHGAAAVIASGLADRSAALKRRAKKVVR